MLRSPQVSCDFEMQIELSLQSCAHLADLIFQNCSERESFLTCWSANRALATVLCTFCRQLSLIAASNKRNIDPTSATHGATSLKKHKVSRPIMFSPVNSRAPEPVNYFSTALTCKLFFLTILSTWWKDFPCIFIHNLEVFELNFLWP